MIKKLYFYLSLTVISAVYIVASLLAPLSSNRFNLTPAKTHSIQIAVLLPIVIIWWIAAMGAERFKSYTSQIKQHPDGRGLDKISTGLVILVVAIIIGGVFGVLRAWALNNGWLAAYTNISNHLTVIGPLIAFAYMFSGSLELNKITKKKQIVSRNALIFLLILLLIAAAYVKILLNYKYLESTPDPTKYSSFYMSPALVFLTIGLPYLIGWGLGIMTAVNLVRYRAYVKGIIYKAMLLRLVVGIPIVIGFYFAVQLLIAFSTFFAKAGLSSILLIVYLLIIAYAIGFLVIASGAKKLAQIEKV